MLLILQKDFYSSYGVFSAQQLKITAKLNKYLLS